MVEIREVKTKKERKEFCDLPNRMYKGNPYYIPPLYMDELSIFTDKNIYNKTCDQVFYLAYKEGKVVGRIQGIIQKDYNRIHNEKRARFSRFDSINDKEVSKALFDAFRDWAKEKDMNILCGPLGYSDLEREGLLIEGFNELNTFEEQYNYEYYKDLIEDYGFIKEVDWVESYLTLDKSKVDKIYDLSDKVMKRWNLHYVEREKHESKSKFIDRVVPGVFYLIDEGYKKLYGTMPFTEEMKKSIIDEFKLFIDTKYVTIIADENERYLAFGLAFPAFGEALQKSSGKLTPLCILRLLKLLKHPKGVDLGLTAVDPEYLNMGINVPVMKKIIQLLDSGEIEYMQTNLNLEDNVKIRAFWKYFNSKENKRRRSFIKHI